MSPHVDILEQPEHLRGPFVGSILFHAGIVLLFGGIAWIQNGSAFSLGAKDGGGRIGTVLVNPVSINLPNRGGQTNPVANDTKSHVPTPPPEKKAAPKAPAKTPDLSAVPLPSKNATKKPSWWVADQPNKYRAKEQFKDNQVYSRAGQALSSPMFQIQGGGGVGLSGSNSPFGTQFGAYADLLVSRVGQAWKQPGVSTAGTPPRVVVSFILRRDGSVANVRISQRSGNSALDYSAQRAISDAAPFPPFPQGLNKNELPIDFIFELSH